MKHKRGRRRNESEADECLEVALKLGGRPARAAMEYEFVYRFQKQLEFEAKKELLDS